MYRDIIFGNNRKHEMIPYRKFAIVESAKYQNIPRTIHNVFLNSKLDADFIKDTIIRSMSDEDFSVDLDFYRSQIKEFEQEYRDVMLWFTKNKNGEVPVRKMAGKVMNAYRDLIYTQMQIGEGRAELNFAERRTLQEIPLVKEELAKGGVGTGVCGPRVRTVTACQGSEVCPSGCIDTYTLAKELDARYFGRELPHKFKFVVTGCQNNCLKAEENDVGIKGEINIEYNE